MLPPFDVGAISETGGSGGAMAVTNFADAQAAKMEKSLATGDTEKLSATVSTAMSNLEGIKVSFIQTET